MGSRESRRQQPSRKSRRLEEIQRRQSQDQGQATLQPAVSVRGPLSEKNLRAHNESLEMIRGRKRKQSLLPIDTETTSVQSQKSSGTASWYRWTTLRNAKVFFRGWPPPKDIQDQINAIVEKASPMERKDSLASITETLCKNFAKVLNRASMEDDCVEIFYNALSFMNQLEHLALSRKADWRLSLKPNITPFSIPNVVPQAAGAASPGIDSSTVKTPRPDITIGIDTDTLISKFPSEILDPDQAEEMLQHLQQTTLNRDGRNEPILCSEPTSQATQIRFPFLIVEGKSYSTGKSIFEAQNQAAVSGACALKILHDLAELEVAKNADRGGDYAKPANPLVFSVCTQGPIHELWAHYTTVENSIRKFNMVPVKTCHVTFRSSILEFLTAVDNVMSWGSGDFLDDIAKRLGKVAKHAGQAAGGDR